MNFIESMMLYYGNELTMDENESKITGKITSEMVEDFESRIIRPKRPYSPSIGVKETKASTIPAETIAADKISTINMIIADEHKDTEDKDLDKSFDHRHLKEKLPRATWEEISTNLTASLNEFFLESEDNRKLFKFKLINSVMAMWEDAKGTVSLQAGSEVALEGFRVKRGGELMIIFSSPQEMGRFSIDMNKVGKSIGVDFLNRFKEYMGIDFYEMLNHCGAQYALTTVEQERELMSELESIDKIPKDYGAWE